MYNLALRLTEFCKDADFYGWIESYTLDDDGFNRSVDDNYDLLTQIDGSIIDYLDTFIDDVDNVYHDRALELKTDILKYWY